MKTLFSLLLAMLLSTTHASATELVTGGKKHPFEPGDQVLLKQDFSRCPVGEPPEGFDEIQGVPECVKFGDHIWVAPASAADLKLYKKIDLGNGDFAIEFSLVLHKPEYAWAVLELYKASDRGWHAEKLPHTLVMNAYCEVRLDGAGKLAEFRHCKEKVQHFAIQVRRGQLRVFLNGKRLASTSFALKAGERVSGFALMRVRGAHPYEALFSDIRVSKYSSKEARPTPEQLGIQVSHSRAGMKLTVPERVLFDFNQFLLKPEAREALAVIADLVREKRARKIKVTGYTDNVGSAAYNLRLSLQRAQSVADYLIYCHKLAPRRFVIEGKGEADPVADNGTEAGRARNRRVEIELLQ